MHLFVSTAPRCHPGSVALGTIRSTQKKALSPAPIERRIGRFENQGRPDGGTLFLDEIADLPPETQGLYGCFWVRCSEREFERIGSTKPVQVDVRVLAATNRDLAADVEDGDFRQDLYYRLNVFPVEVPPLRERIEDIPLLAEYLLERYAKKAGKKITAIDRSTIEMLAELRLAGQCSRTAERDRARRDPL